MEESSKVSWGSLWAGLTVGFVVELILVYIFLKNNLLGISLMGEMNYQGKFLYYIWLAYFVTGLSSGVVVAVMNKKSAIMNGVYTGLLCTAINMLAGFAAIFFIFVLSSQFNIPASKLWDIVTRLIWELIKVNFPFVVGGFLGGLIIYFSTGGSNSETVAQDQSSGHMPGPAVLNDSLPPIVAQKNKEIETQAQVVQPAVDTTHAAEVSSPVEAQAQTVAPSTDLLGGAVPAQPGPGLDIPVSGSLSGNTNGSMAPGLLQQPLGDGSESDNSGEINRGY